VYTQVHTGERRHQCGVCDKRFSEPSSVKRHMYVHSRHEAPHACPTCGRRYAAPCYLREHLLSHSGARPCKCPVCDKQYSRAGHLTRHLRQHKRQTAAAPLAPAAGDDDGGQISPGSEATVA